MRGMDPLNQNEPAASEDALVILLASGATKEEAASGSGYSVSTIKRRLKSPAFQARIEAAKVAFTRRALDRLLSLRFKHIENIDRLASADPPPDGSADYGEYVARLESGTVRLNASKSIIELGSKLLAEHEFERRLRAVEERLAAQQQGGGAP